MLTGEQTTRKLYDYWAKILLLDCKKINLYWGGGEREVPGDHLDSKYCLVKSPLFAGKPKLKIKTHQIKILDDDLEVSARAYE